MYFCKYTWSEILSFHLRTPWFCGQQEHLQLWCSKFKPRFGFKVHVDDELKDDNHQLMRKSWQNIVTAKVTFLWRHKTWSCMTWRHMTVKDDVTRCDMMLYDVTSHENERCDMMLYDVTSHENWRCDMMLCDVTSWDL